LEKMTKIVYHSQITITREKGPTRKAEIEGFAKGQFKVYSVIGRLDFIIKKRVFTNQTSCNNMSCMKIKNSQLLLISIKTANQTKRL